MRMTGLLLLAVAGSLQACTPEAPKIDPQAGCEKDIRQHLLNPETAEFFDFTEIDRETYGEAVLPIVAAESNFPAGKTIVDLERSQIATSSNFYRIRVRAEGELGNKVTKHAYCKRLVASSDLCFCKLVD